MDQCGKITRSAYATFLTSRSAGSVDLVRMLDFLATTVCETVIQRSRFLLRAGQIDESLVIRKRAIGETKDREILPAQTRTTDNQRTSARRQKIYIGGDIGRHRRMRRCGRLLLPFWTILWENVAPFPQSLLAQSFHAITPDAEGNDR